MRPVAMFRHVPDQGLPDQLSPRCKDCEGIATGMDVIAQKVNVADTQLKVAEILEVALVRMGGIEGFGDKLARVFMDPKTSTKGVVDIGKMVVKMAEFCDTHQPKKDHDLSGLTTDELQGLAHQFLSQKLIADATPAVTEPINDAQPPSTAAGSG